MSETAAITAHGDLHEQPGAEDQDRKTSFTIGELAREFGLTLRAIRFYEDKGLLSPRRQGMTRIYSRRDRARLKLILLGKRVGFSLVEIGEMLDLYDLKDGQETQLRVAMTKFDEQISFLDNQRVEIENALVDLRRARDVVAGMLKEKEDSR